MQSLLVISRGRPLHQSDTSTDDSATALSLAAKFNIKVLDIPFLYDLPADSSIIQRLRSLSEPAYFLVPLSCRSAKSLLEYLQIPFAEVFETSDTVQIRNGGISGGHVERLEENSHARWYPIIDDSLCSACLECVNYCLFGVYSIGTDSRPVVDQPDACRDGCPACSRVCPSNAIMFPLYEDRIIAGYELPSPDEMDNLIDIVDQI